MKKTTYAIMGLIVSGFVIIFGVMLVARAVGKPYPPYYYDDSVLIESVGDTEEDVEIEIADTLALPVATENRD